MYEFIPLAEPEPLEPFDLDGMLDLVNSSSNVFEGLVRESNAMQDVQLSDLVESRSMTTTSLSEHNRNANFLGLPAEIRLYIYELALDNETRMPPPITQVSHLGRKESQEYWYGAARFPLRFRIAGWFEGSPGRTTPSYYMVSPVDEPAYPMLRKLQLKVEGNAQHCYSVNLGKGPKSYSIKHGPCYGTDRMLGSTDGSTERLMKQFDRALAEMVGSRDVGDLTFNHYTRLILQPSWKFWSDIPDKDD